MSGGRLAGTGTLLRLALRGDRVLAPVVVLVLGALAAGSAAATIELYPGAEAREEAAAAANATPALRALYGEVGSSLGALATFKLVGTVAVFVALIAMVLVRRHTRAEEEQGRTELVLAGATSRHAPLTAALLETGVVLAATAVVAAVGLAATGLPVVGSIALGVAWLVAGGVFAGVAAVAAQLSQSARTVAAVTGSAIAVAFAMRAAGDVDPGSGWRVLSWVSPLGWVQQVKPFHGDHLWVGLLGLALTAALVASAYLLRARRDVGAGLVPDRPGPARGRIGSPLGLAWRLQRSALVGWSLALLLAGVLFGGLGANVEGFLDSPEAQQMVRSLGGEGALSDAFVALEFSVLAVVVSGFGVAAVLRLLGEETSSRAELALSTATSRLGWMSSHVVLALAGTAGVMVLMGVGAGFADTASSGDLAGSMGRMVEAALVQVPAIWVVVGAAVLLYGTSSRIALGAWGFLALFLLLGQLADLLRLPAWTRDLSPFTHVPALPGGAVRALPLVVLVVVATAAVGAGAGAFRRRDVA